MEYFIIAAILIFIFAVGCWIGSLSKDTVMVDSYLLEAERRKRYEEEQRAWESEYGNTLYRPTARAAIERRNLYNQGFYDGKEDAWREKTRFATMKETEQMFNKLAKAMKPLEELKKEIGGPLL